MNTLFSTALFLFCVYILGFLAAIPIGASQIEVARRALNGHLVSALIVVAGSVSSDFVYGVIALFGLAPFLQKPLVEAVFWFVNAVLILGFAIVMLRDSKTGGNLKIDLNVALDNSKIGGSSSRLPRLANRRLAYFTGFSLAFTNPLMIAWWLLAARFLKDIGVSTGLTNTSRVFFLVAGCLGIGSYLSLLGVTIYRRHKSFLPKHVSGITRWFGIAMIFFAIYFVIRSIMMLNTPESSKNSSFGTLLRPEMEIHSVSILYITPNHLVSLHS